jgi:hypothetical protein
MIGIGTGFEEYVQLIGRMQETLHQVDHFLSDKLGYPEDHPVRLSIAKRLAEAEELASE